MRQIFIVGTVLLLIGILYEEFRFGFLQELAYKYRVERYLDNQYNEPMHVKSARYLWDNIEPLSAQAFPLKDPNLLFTVYPSKERASGYADSYPTTLWKAQAEDDVHAILQQVGADYRQPYIEFSCCAVGHYDFESVQGDVPSYKETNLTFDIIFQIERHMEKEDEDQIYSLITLLNQYEYPRIGSLIINFKGPAPKTCYRFDGYRMHAIDKKEELKYFNSSYLPVSDVVEVLGADYHWNPDTRQAVLIANDIRLEINSRGKDAIVNGEKTKSPLDFYINESGQIMLPIQYLEQLFGIDNLLFKRVQGDDPSTTY